MTDDDRAVARPLLELLVAGEPPLHLRTSDLAAAGRRRKARTAAVGAAVLATVAALVTVAALATSQVPRRPTYHPAPKPTVELVPAPGTQEPEPAVPGGAVDVLTPAQEAWLVQHDTAAFDRAYRPPAGWRVSKRIPFLTDPGISDEAWNGGVELTDATGRVANVGVVVARRRSPGSDCLSSAETVPVGGGVGHVRRTGGRSGQVEVCWLRPDGLEVTALTAKGAFIPGEPVRPAPERPETVARLAALAADPGFGWPA